jgi:two-component system, cell cycle response regulator
MTDLTQQLQIENEKLVVEHAKVKRVLEQLLSSAKENQRTQDNFYQLELFFLQASNFKTLLKRLLVDFKTKFNIQEIELIIYDKGDEVKSLCEEIYGELDFHNLHFSHNASELEALYQPSEIANQTNASIQTIKLQLIQSQTKIKSIFKTHNFKIKSAVLMPLMRNNQLIASLQIGSTDKERFEPSLATNFLEHLGSIISVCIENSLNQERFIHLSLVDVLTRTKNRRYFFQAMAKEIAKASRSLKPLCCLYLDIDHFKKINDHHGHHAGDEALIQVAKAIKPVLRTSDTLARFGGEEFTILLTECDLDTAQKIAERIRESIADLNITLTDQQKIKLTVSIGVSCWQSQGENKINPLNIQSGLINDADQALYRAKHNGRNKVELCVSTR